MNDHQLENGIFVFYTPIVPLGLKTSHQKTS